LVNKSLIQAVHPIDEKGVVMATGTDPDMCAVTMPASRRFYVHVGSLGFLVAAQSSMYDEVAQALALSGASRALDQAVEDLEMFPPAGEAEPGLDRAAMLLHNHAADALRLAFQCMVHLVPPRFGATELLLGTSEQISAWCFEDGYLTYATDEDAAAIMYAETGSLRQLRSDLRRSPDYDPSLQMISGHSLFLFDQRVGTGPGTALFYRQQAARLLRAFRPAETQPDFDEAAVAKVIQEYVSPLALTFDGVPIINRCLHRAGLMVDMLNRSLPPALTPAPAPAGVRLPPPAACGRGPGPAGCSSSAQRRSLIARPVPAARWASVGL
jgi:hypothetical protein